MAETIYKKIDDDNILYNSKETVNNVIWTNDEPVIDINNDNIYINADTPLSNHFYNVYLLPSEQTQPTEADIPNFTISYLCAWGCSSLIINTDYVDTNDRSKKTNLNTYSYVNYKSIKNLIGSTDDFIYLKDDSPSYRLYAISINQSLLKDKIAPGSFQMVFTDLINVGNTITLTERVNNSDTNILEKTEEYIIINNNNDSIVGKIFYDLNLILLDVDLLNGYTNNNFDYTEYGYYINCENSLSEEGLEIDNDSTTGQGIIDWNVDVNPVKVFIDVLQTFQLTAIKIYTSIIYIINIGLKEFNYSTNPTFSDSDGNIIYPTFYTNPVTYITTIGFYNDKNELVAVARLNKPIPKTFEDNISLKVKLQF